MLINYDVVSSQKRIASIIATPQKWVAILASKFSEPMESLWACHEGVRVRSQTAHQLSPEPDICLIKDIGDFWRCTMRICNHETGSRISPSLAQPTFSPTARALAVPNIHNVELHWTAPGKIRPWCPSFFF